MSKNRQSCRYLNDLTQGQIIEKMAEGRNVTSVPVDFGIVHSLVLQVWGAFQITGLQGCSSSRLRATRVVNYLQLDLQSITYI
ncbi:hypothetical protein TNCV_2874201 [Trichonephila clavipes]|nr:hypothetical protein TNCV_2874201 [Trichonephila clavipes]